MVRPLARLLVLAPAFAAAALGTAAPAEAGEPDPPFEYVRCFDVTVESATGMTPVVTVCSPV